MMDRGGVQVCQPYMTTCGGLTEAKRIVELAQARGALVCPGNWSTQVLGAATVHLAAYSPITPVIEFSPSQIYWSPLRKAIQDARAAGRRRRDRAAERARHRRRPAGRSDRALPRRVRTGRPGRSAQEDGDGTDVPTAGRAAVAAARRWTARPGRARLSVARGRLRRRAADAAADREAGRGAQASRRAADPGRGRDRAGADPGRPRRPRPRPPRRPRRPSRPRRDPEPPTKPADAGRDEAGRGRDGRRQQRDLATRPRRRRARTIAYKGPLQIATWFSRDEPGAAVRYFQGQLIREWAKLHPDVKVEMFAVAGRRHAAVDARPDGRRHRRRRWRSTTRCPRSSSAAGGSRSTSCSTSRAPYTGKPWKEDFPYIDQAMRPQPDTGKRFAVPIVKTGDAAFYNVGYNVEIYRKAGIDVDKDMPPKSWTEWKKMNAEIKKAGFIAGLARDHRRPLLAGPAHRAAADGADGRPDAQEDRHQDRRRRHGRRHPLGQAAHRTRCSRASSTTRRTGGSRSPTG